MYPAKFDYVRAHSIEEALQLLSQHEDAKLLAGGHSLIPMMKLRLAQPTTVIDIGRIDGLRGVRRISGDDGDTLQIGALTTHAELAASAELREHAPVIAEAAAAIGDAQVRHRGTIGGNIAHADPASDLPAALLAAGATVHLQGPSGTRTVPASAFFVDLLTTDLGMDELVTGVEVPVRGEGTGQAYLKFEHPASGYAVVGAAAAVSMRGGECTAASIYLNGVCATPLDGSAVAAKIAGTAADDATINAAVAALTAEDPLADVYASGEYRAHLAKVYAKRALKAARDRA
ncbi:MAG: xanthine dehydrogenase family protein subunit M [Acidobacteria bacterium]|nr:MAG: xanthine dehydrogenase family protein subunit M [Acidobacteriota bacterium]REK03881.1 MAG: xanthine dehydrogenase family protein subunit M [Acidobacteriota bacterium]